MMLGYCRVSTREQAQDGRTSLESQEQVVRGLAMLRGLSTWDTAIYQDAGVSASVPLARRPAGKKLLDEAQTGDVIVASKLDRMFRSAIDALSNAEALKERGVDLILYDMGAEPVTGNGVAKFFFTLLAAMAELERTKIAERIGDGRRGKRARGGHAGGGQRAWRDDRARSGRGADPRLCARTAARVSQSLRYCERVARARSRQPVRHPVRDHAGQAADRAGERVVTLAEFNEIVLLVCPHCRDERPLRQRPDTKEYVHDWREGSSTMHTICWASRFRNSRFAEEAE